jgi:hypothetical protein
MLRMSIAALCLCGTVCLSPSAAIACRLDVILRLHGGYTLICSGGGCCAMYLCNGIPPTHGCCQCTDCCGK